MKGEKWIGRNLSIHYCLRLEPVSEPRLGSHDDALAMFTLIIDASEHLRVHARYHMRLAFASYG